MTNKRKPTDELRDLSDRIDESILIASDDEVSEELVALGLDPKKAVMEMDAIAEEAKLRAGKLLLANAKEAAHAFRSKRPVTTVADRSVLGARLQQMRSARPGASSAGMTMAARKGQHLTESDEVGALDDLAQLDALESEDLEASKE